MGWTVTQSERTRHPLPDARYRRSMVTVPVPLQSWLEPLADLSPMAKHEGATSDGGNVRRGRRPTGASLRTKRSKCVFGLSRLVRLESAWRMVCGDALAHRAGCCVSCPHPHHTHHRSGRPRRPRRPRRSHPATRPTTPLPLLLQPRYHMAWAVGEDWRIELIWRTQRWTFAPSRSERSPRSRVDLASSITSTVSEPCIEGVILV